MHRVHGVVAAREQRAGWEARWGDEEPARIGATGVSASTSTAAAGTQADAHPAYAGEKIWRLVLFVRFWSPLSLCGTGIPIEAVFFKGEESTRKEHLPGYGHLRRLVLSGLREDSALFRSGLTRQLVHVFSAVYIHPMSALELPTVCLPTHRGCLCWFLPFPARAQRPGWETRWGSEEPARMASATTSTATAVASSSAGSVKGEAATALADSHPAYVGEKGRKRGLMVWRTNGVGSG